jgi:hypothetical protein
VARRAERTQEATPREVILIKSQIFDRSLVFTEGLNDLRTKRTLKIPGERDLDLDQRSHLGTFDALREVVFTEIEGYEAPNFGQELCVYRLGFASYDQLNGP